MPNSKKAFDCPNCGEPVPAGALACPACGADHETGWSEDTVYDDLDLPDPGYGEEPPPREPRWFAAAGVIVLVIALVIVFVLLGVW